MLLVQLSLSITAFNSLCTTGQSRNYEYPPFFLFQGLIRKLSSNGFIQNSLMQNTLVITSLAFFLAACNSSDITVAPPADENPSGSIIIGTDSREELTQIPLIEFNGEFESTASPELGFGGSAESDSGRPATDFLESDSDGFGGGPGTGPILVPGNPLQPIEPGTLTAGDYDDHLNPASYQLYASEYLQRRGRWIDVPRIDFNNRIRIEVSDQSGLPYADAKVDISSVESQQVIELHTAANGIAALYNDIDSLPASFTLGVTGTDGTSVEQRINLQSANEAGKILVSLPRDNEEQGAAADSPLDLMFVIDTTGSMSDELNFIQTELSDIINSVTQQQSDINIGLVFYRDYGDQYVVRAHDFSASLNGVQLDLNQEQANGGGDNPEAMDQALETALGASWRDSSRKVMFLVADAPPHGDRMRATWNAAEQARLNSIHIVPVAASGTAEDAEYIMRSVAALTNSRYLFLTDDSGFGLPHAEPDIDCYVVTSLRDTMIRTLGSLITGTRIEPSASDIVRQVGNYNDGVCGPENSGNVTVASSVIVLRGNGGVSEQTAIEVISDQAALDSQLARYGEVPMAVDFNEGQVILFDAGPKNNGGFSIEVASIEAFDNHVEANIALLQPGPNCGVTNALTHPFIFVYIETTKELQVSNSTVTRNCE